MRHSDGLSAYSFCSSGRLCGGSADVQGMPRVHERVHATRNGREYVVLLSAEDLESLEATIEFLCDNSAMSRVREAEAAATADDLTTAEEMAKLMAERRMRQAREG